MAAAPAAFCPELEVALADGSSLRLPPAGRWLALYFYPKSNTPGCNSEAMDFNALLPQFQALGCDVVGVSRDSVRTQQNYRAKLGLDFAMASDPDGTLCAAFDVIREKMMYGRPVVGIQRSTFLVAPGGRIAQEWRGVRVPGHAAAVLAALSTVQGVPA